MSSTVISSSRAPSVMPRSRSPAATIPTAGSASAPKRSVRAGAVVLRSIVMLWRSRAPAGGVRDATRADGHRRDDGAARKAARAVVDAQVGGLDPDLISRPQRPQFEKAIAGSVRTHLCAMAIHRISIGGPGRSRCGARHDRRVARRGRSSARDPDVAVEKGSPRVCSADACLPAGQQARPRRDAAHPRRGPRAARRRVTNASPADTAPEHDPRPSGCATSDTARAGRRGVLPASTRVRRGARSMGRGERARRRTAGRDGCGWRTRRPCGRSRARRRP